jgi:hypothetical protein
MTQEFGEFEPPPDTKDYFLFGFSPSSSFPEQTLWKANGLLADSLANYLTLFYPNRNVQELQENVGYLANELLENARKFQDTNAEEPFQIKFLLYQDCLILSAKNTIPPENVKKFQSFLKVLKDLHEDELKQLSLQEIKKAAETGNTDVSRLGLLTMLKDYKVKLGWRFETVQQIPEVIVVTTMARLAIG